MKKIIAATAAFGAFASAGSAQAADFVFNTVNSGKVTGSGYGNAFTYSGSDGSRSITMKATGWSRGFDGAFTAGEIASFGSDGLGIYQQGERRDGGYHQIDNINGWEFLILQFSEAVTLQSAKLNSFGIDDRNYTDNDAFIGWNSSTLGLGTALTGTDAAKLFDTRLGGFNSNSDAYKTALQTYALPLAKASNVWIVGGSFNGPDDRNDFFKVAQLTVAAVPEPTTWAMMLVGFAMVGAAARYRRRSTKIALA